MLRTLGQLTPEEMRGVAAQCGARPGASPEEIIRCLSRLCGVYVWGILPTASEEVLLDHLGRRLGMRPMVPGPRALPAREREIFACYVRQGWDAAGPEAQRSLVEMALAAWDSTSLPSPRLPDAGARPDGATHHTLEALLAHTAGCRALAQALETVRLPLPVPGTVHLPFSLPNRATGGHQATYAVLAILWRARARRLQERRLQRAQLERQWRQVESLLRVRRKNLDAAPVGWELNPLNGLSVAAAAAISILVHTGLAATTAATLAPALLVGAAGLVWSASAWSVRPKASTDERVSRMHAQLQTFRHQLSRVEREILELEAD